MLPRPMIKILLVCMPGDGIEKGSRWAYWIKEGSWGRSLRFYSRLPYNIKQKSTLILQFALDCSERSFPRKGGGPVGPYKGGRPYGAFQVGKVLWGLPL